MAEPLRAMVMGAPLEDARHLAQRYDRMRQEAEAQVPLICVYQRLSDGFIPATTILWSVDVYHTHIHTIVENKYDQLIFFDKYVIVCSFEPRQAIEVSKRQAKVRETPGNSETIMKLEAAEAKLQDLKLNMGILGKEAAAAMAAVEAQQQRLTLQRLIAMVLQVLSKSSLS